MWPSTSTYRVILVLIVFQAYSAWSLSDKRLCADPKCQSIISLARAKVSYPGNEVGRISFKINSPIRVKSKSAGSDLSLWGIEVNGRQGYAPKEFILEEKILIKEKDVNIEVPVEVVGISTNQAIDVPIVKLNPSEVIVEEKVKATETPLTVPLESGKEATPLPLNASESDVEPTTAPLTVADAEIVNQSLRETITPTLNSFEMIDGTAIPIAEEGPPQDTSNSESVNAGSEPNESVTTKLDTILTTNLEKDPDTSKQETEAVKLEEHNQENLLNNIETIDVGSNVITEQEAKNIEVDNIETNPVQMEQATMGSPAMPLQETALEIEANSAEMEHATKETTTIVPQETISEVESIDVSPEQAMPEPAIAMQQNLPENATPSEPAESIIPETPVNANPVDIPVPKKSETDDLLHKEDIFETSSEGTIQTISSIPPAVVQQEGLLSDIEKSEILQPNADIQKQDSVLTNENGPFVYPFLNDDDDDDDDDEDNDLGDVEENYAKNPSTTADLVTPNPLQDSTDSGFHTMPSKKYWEEDEEIVSTTLAPQTVIEETKAEFPNEVKNAETIPTAAVNDANASTVIPDAVEEPAETTLKATVNESDNFHTTTSKPDAVEEHEETTQKSAVTESNNIEASTVIPDAVKEPVEATQKVAIIESENMHASTVNPIAVEEPVVDSNTEAVESNPIHQVPSMPTTLPIFQQPTLPPIYQDHQHVQHAEYENPNDYYREQNLKLQAESNYEKNSAESFPSNPTQHNTESTVPLSNEHYSTGSFEQDVNVRQNDESSNTGVPTIEEIPTTSTIPEPHNDMPTYVPKEEKREAGLFTTILGTVNTLVSKLRKEPQKNSHEGDAEDAELQHILYPDRFASNKDVQKGEQYCEKLSPHDCPQQQQQMHMASSSSKSSENYQCHYDWSHINMDNFIDIFLAKAFEMREFLSCLAITATASLLFLFGYYCFCNSNREGALISKLNQLERSLLASHKENAILKDDLLKTRTKLTSIEDNSFGSNDMVMAVKKELELLSTEKQQLQEHVHSLEKELETAAEAGLELNKIVAELLNNQSGQESMIMNSVEDLQTQFNEQQKTIVEINANLAEKSRENSELQLMLAEQNVRLNGEIASLQQDNDELEAEKANLQTRIEELKTEFEEDITKALESKNVEIKRLQSEIMEIRKRFEDIHTKWQTSLAKIEALEDCMKTMKKDPSVKISELINAANVKAELLDLQQQRASLKSLLDTETEARQHAEASLKNTISEVDRLKQDFHQSEKDKLEAQTRLEVLSNYFKEKETQLQKELSLKEAIWLKQQGENTSTVDRLTAMQDEIQSLKSQNDALRAEIEAQIAAHKAQTGTLENRAHETWLAARQSERRYEETRAEAAALRRRLTELAGATNLADPNRTNVDSKMSSTELTNAPSPIMPPPLMDTAGSPLLGRLPPPQFMPFLGPPPPPFLNLPPPPFLSSVEMRPAPLGRMMSPPLGRFSPPPPPPRERVRDYYEDDYDYDDDDDYDAEEDDYDYDDDDDISRQRRQRRRSGNGSDSWQRHNYSPPPPDRSYRSHSPADSRYNYPADRDLMSTYETDLSPPSSPPARGGISGNGGARTGNYTYSPASTKESTISANKSGKGLPNSDSDKSYNSTHQKKKGGKSMV